MIEIAEVSGEEPAVAHDGGGGVRTVPVTFHHDRSPQRDFADGWLAVFRRLGVHDVAFDAFERLAYGADHVVAGRNAKHGCGSFSEAVGLQYVNAEVGEIAGDGGIEARASGGEVAHLASERVVNLGEEDRSGVDAQLAEKAIGSHEQAQGASGQRAAF